MLSQEQLERYRRMTPGERLRVSMEMTRWNLAFLDTLPPEEARRRWKIILQQHREGNQRLAEALSRLS